MIGIDKDDPGRADVQLLIAEHLADMYATSPLESMHALDPGELAAPSITFWTAREDGVLLGCGALKELAPAHGELKSMRTATLARGRGVASAILAVIVAEARRRDYERISLETGSEDFFAPARRLYLGHGFAPCAPFAEYTDDPNSIYLSIAVADWADTHS